MNIASFQAQLKQLKITELNKQVFIDLLKLPYSEFKPLMEMLLNGKLVPEDFMDAYGVIPPISLATMQAKIAANTASIDGAFIAEQAINKVKGEAYVATSVKTVDLKREAVTTNPSAANKSLPYNAVGNKVVQSTVFEDIVTTSYDGKSITAQKTAQQKLS